MLKSKDPNNPWHQKPEDLTWLKGIKDEVDVKYNQLASSYIPVIIDVGLARIADINDFDTYKLKTPDLKLPIDYLAYESFVTDPNEFSLESDVWMLGVCLWEMSTYCRRKPYEKELRAFKQKSSKVYSNKVDLLKDYLGSGGRIELRHDMPKAIQSILRDRVGIS